LFVIEGYNLKQNLLAKKALTIYL